MPEEENAPLAPLMDKLAGYQQASMDTNTPVVEIEEPLLQAPEVMLVGLSACLVCLSISVSLLHIYGYARQCKVKCSKYYKICDRII